MKAALLLSAIVAMSFSAFAAESIHNWKSTELKETEALTATKAGVAQFVEEKNNCSLDSVFGFEAVNHMVNGKGEPAIIVWSTARADGASCALDAYLDCSTSFHKVEGRWTYITTTCEPEEVVE